jgi:hypothetical protein
VGVSRITDFKHHPSDVVAGAFLGSLIGMFYLVRAVARLDRVVEDSAAAAAEAEAGSSTPQAGTALLYGAGAGSIRVQNGSDGTV